MLEVIKNLRMDEINKELEGIKTVEDRTVGSVEKEETEE
jgi:hypothetical protein